MSAKQVKTIEQAKALLAKSTPMPEYAPGQWLKSRYAVAENRPVDRPDFSITRFETVLLPNGSRAIRSYKERRSGIPVFEFDGFEHADDSHWIYPVTELILISGPPFSQKSIPLAKWQKITGRIGYRGPGRNLSSPLKKKRK